MDKTIDINKTIAINFDINELKKHKFKEILGRHGHKLIDILNSAIDDYIKNNGVPKWLSDEVVTKEVEEIKKESKEI